MAKPTGLAPAACILLGLLAHARAEEPDLVTLNIRGPRSDTDALIEALLQRAYKAHADQIRQRLDMPIVLDRPFTCTIFKDPGRYPVPDLPSGTVDGYTTPTGGVMFALVPSWTAAQAARLGLPMREAWVVAHESCHQVCVRAGLGRLPPWYAEGLAEFLADEVLRKEGMPSVAMLRHMPPLYHAKQHGVLPSTVDVLDGGPLSWDRDVEYYAMAWALMAMLREKKSVAFAKFEMALGKAFREANSVDPDAVTKQFLEMCGPAAALDEALKGFIRPQQFGWSGGDLSVVDNRWTLAATTDEGAWVFEDNTPSLAALPAEVTLSLEIPAAIGTEARIEIWDREAAVSVCLDAKASALTIATRDRTLAERHVAAGTLNKRVSVRVSVDRDRIAVLLDGETSLDTGLPRQLEPPLRLWLGQHEGITMYELPPTMEAPKAGADSKR